MGFFDDPGVLANNLTFPIHALFHPDRWDEIWDLDYELMSPALRLASAILSSPASVAFHFALIYNDRRRIPHRGPEHQPWGTLFDEINLAPPKAPYRPMRIAVESRLRQLVPFIQLRLVDPLNPAWSTIPLTGSTMRLHELPLFEHKEDEDPIGTGSVVEISYGFFNELRFLQQQAVTPRITSEILGIQLSFAETLCHELAHAIDQASTMFLGPFVEDQRISEVGWAWSSEVFGGAIHSVDSSSFFPATIAKWPGFQFRSNQNTMLERGLPKRLTTSYFVPLRWASSIQQQAFWDALAESTDRDCLKIPKTIGVQSEYPGDDFDPDWKSDASSEGRYRGDERGRVTRV